MPHPRGSESKPNPKLIRPTLQDLRLQNTIPPATLDHMHALVIQLIQNSADTEALKEARGYRDDYTGQRHPGLADELEGLLIAHDLGETGFRVENYTISIVPGSRHWIDEDLLLAEGIPPDTILRCRRSTSWTSLQVRKNPERRRSD